MDARLIQLLGSFISATSEYTLARLEFALEHPQLPAPPPIARLPDASENTLSTAWEEAERQLESVRAYLRQLDDARGKRSVYDRSFAYLQRTYRELDQYARALRWIMTIEDKP